MRKALILGHLLPLLIGGLIYIAFRSDSLLMFDWFATINVDKPIDYLRGTTLEYTGHLPNWFTYSLPDGLWIFSYTSLILLIWGNKIKKHNLFWLLIIPLTAIISEAGQLFNLVPGTFDTVDLTFYFLGTTLPILLFSHLFTFKTAQ